MNTKLNTPIMKELDEKYGYVNISQQYFDCG